MAEHRRTDLIDFALVDFIPFLICNRHRCACSAKRDPTRVFASIPYHLEVNLEAYYHALFYAFMSALGFDKDLEVAVAKGRVEVILELEDKVYVMEFKCVGCPEGASEEKEQELSSAALAEAMVQIDSRGYSAKYQGSGKTMYQAAFAFLGRSEIEMRV